MSKLETWFEQIMYVLFFSIFSDSSLLTKIPEKKSKHFDHNFEILKICFLLGNKFVNKNRAGKKIIWVDTKNKKTQLLHKNERRYFPNRIVQI